MNFGSDAFSLLHLPVVDLSIPSKRKERCLDAVLAGMLKISGYREIIPFFR